MKVILVYDISLIEKEGQKRLPKIMKIVRKYLNHIQKSVFEGELTPSKLAKMEFEIMQVVDREKDSVIIYTLPDSIRIERKILTNVSDPTSNII